MPLLASSIHDHHWDAPFMHAMSQIPAMCQMEVRIEESNQECFELSYHRTCLDHMLEKHCKTSKQQSKVPYQSSYFLLETKGSLLLMEPAHHTRLEISKKQNKTLKLILYHAPQHDYLHGLIGLC